MRPTITAVGVLALLVLTAACTNAAPDGPTRVEPSAGDVPLASASVLSSGPSATAGNGQTTAQRFGPAPLQAYNLTADQSDTITRATDTLVAACMAQQGFTYRSTPTSAQVGDSNDWAAYLGVTDVNQAQQYGYRTPGATGAGGLSDAEQKILNQGQNPTAQDKAYQAALLGPNFPEVSSDACYPKSNAQLIPSGTPPDLDIQSELAQQATASTTGDPAVVAAKQTWVACMADQGYTLDAIPLPSLDAELSKKVIDQAVADVRCKDSSGLTDAYITALYAAEKSLIQAHLSDLSAYQGYVDERLRLAAAVLARAK